MIIKKIIIKNFRNYTAQEIVPAENINLFIGNNAQGKTNLLESIYYTAIGKSYRTLKEEDLIKWNEDFFKVEIEVCSLRDFVIKIEKQIGKKKILLSMG